MKPSNRRSKRGTSYLAQPAKLPARAAWATERVDRFNTVFRSLFQDEYFSTLLRGESMLSLPNCLLAATRGGRR